MPAARWTSSPPRPRATSRSPVQRQFGVAWVRDGRRPGPSGSSVLRGAPTRTFWSLAEKLWPSASQSALSVVSGATGSEACLIRIKDVEEIRRIPHFSHHRQTRERFQLFAGDIVKSMQPFISCEPFPHRGRSLRRPPLVAGLGPPSVWRESDQGFPGLGRVFSVAESSLSKRRTGAALTPIACAAAWTCSRAWRRLAFTGRLFDGSKKSGSLGLGWRPNLAWKTSKRLRMTMRSEHLAQSVPGAQSGLVTRVNGVPAAGIIRIILSFLELTH